MPTLIFATHQNLAYLFISGLLTRNKLRKNTIINIARNINRCSPVSMTASLRAWNLKIRKGVSSLPSTIGSHAPTTGTGTYCPCSRHHQESLLQSFASSGDSWEIHSAASCSRDSCAMMSYLPESVNMVIWVGSVGHTYTGNLTIRGGYFIKCTVCLLIS